MIRLRYGNTNTYLLGGLLIDTDLPGTLPAFRRALKTSGVGIASIRYVLATHYHPDHMGLIPELMALGVRLALPENQLAYVHASDAILLREKNGFRPIDEREARILPLSESRRFLSELGLAGEILPTASHSPDGIALMLDGGDCFLGDLEPRAWIPAYEEGSTLQKDWDVILSRHPTHGYFGHANDQAL